MKKSASPEPDDDDNGDKERRKGRRSRSRSISASKSRSRSRSRSSSRSSSSRRSTPPAKSTGGAAAGGNGGLGVDSPKVSLAVSASGGSGHTKVSKKHGVFVHDDAPTTLPISPLPPRVLLPLRKRFCVSCYFFPVASWNAGCPLRAC